MKKKQTFLNSLFLLMGIFIFLLGNLANAADKNRIHAGTAMVCYTPESIPDSLIHDRQFIRVIAFSDGENKALIIAHETKGTSEKLWSEITTRIKDETGIPPEFVMMGAVHTHSGVPMPDDFNDKMISCVKDALANLEPVSVGAGTGTCLMNMNRRAKAASGGIWLGKNPYKPCDHDVDVLRIDSENGEPISIAVNWAAHAVINWPKPELYSGDWPGAAAKYVEEAFHNKITAPILIGASGDVNPLYWAPFEGAKMGTEDVGGREVKIDGLAITGINLGEEAVKVANEIETYPTGRVSAVQKLLTIPGKKRFPSRMPNQEIEQGDDLQVRLSAIKVGDVVFVGYSGEVMTEIGMHLKEQSPYKNTFVVTHCNGSSGYLVTDEALKEGGYEPGGSRSMPGCEKAMNDALLEMINSL